MQGGASPYPDLICPRHGSPLVRGDESMDCPAGHSFPVVEGIPILLRDDVEQTIGLATASLAAGRHRNGAPLYLDTVGISDEEARIAKTLRNSAAVKVDPVVAVLVGATSGRAYRHLVGNLPRHPIPSIGLAQGGGGRLLDVGCSWGRWSIAGARKGYRVTGIDPSLGALLAARRLAIAYGLDIQFVCADARYLPFADGSFDAAHSYSVLQHFALEDAARALGQIGRVLLVDGTSLVQMAHHGGFLSYFHRLRRRFHPAVGFEVRYWSLQALRDTFEAHIGPSALSAHCFFGLGLERDDRDLYTPAARLMCRVSDALVSASTVVTPLMHAADSIYVASTKAGAGARSEVRRPS